MAKAAFNSKKNFFTSKFVSNLKKKLVTWDTSKSRSEIPGKFCNVVPEKDGPDQLDISYGKSGSII
jgi:hypothetical protein